MQSSASQLGESMWSGRDRVRPGNHRAHTCSPGTKSTALVPSRAGIPAANTDPAAPHRLGREPAAAAAGLAGRRLPSLRSCAQRCYRVTDGLAAPALITTAPPKEWRTNTTRSKPASCKRKAHRSGDLAQAEALRLKFKCFVTPENLLRPSAVLPWRCASATPALTRSTIMLRSSSANAARMCMRNLAVGFCLSVSMPYVTAMNRTP